MPRAANPSVPATAIQAAAMARPIHPIKMTTGSGGGAAGRPLAPLPFPVLPFPVRPLAVAGLRPVPVLLFFFGAGLFCPERVGVARGFPVEPWRAAGLGAAGRADVTSIASWAASSSPPRERVDPFRARVAITPR
jgi:hypothetical protein